MSAPRILATLLAMAAAPAAAGPLAPDQRRWHGGLGAGGFVALTGPVRRGLVAGAELLPFTDGPLARWGVRAEGRTLDEDGFERGLVTAGVVWLAAAARPRLALTIHGDAGVGLPDHRAVAGGGVQTELQIIGPLAIALDTTGLVLLDGIDSELVLSTSLTVRVAR